MLPFLGIALSSVLARDLKLIQDNSGKKIFVHCRLGDDRTGMAIAAARVAEEAGLQTKGSKR